MPNTITIENEKYYQTIFFTIFKLNGTAADAMAQIHEKRYFEPYLYDGRPITLIGVEFAQATRNLGEHRIGTLDTGTGGQVRETPAAYVADVTGKPSTRESDRREIARRMKLPWWPGTP